MKEFFRFLEDHYPPGGFTTILQARFGERFGFLEAADILTAAAPAEQYPCPYPSESGCPRRIVRDSTGQLLAICGNHPPMCDTVLLSEADVSRHGFSLPGLAHALCEALGIESRFSGKRLHPVAFFLGESRTPSRASSRFYLAMKPGGRGMETLAEYLANDTGSDQCIVLIPSLRKLDPDFQRECGHRRIAFVPLDECCTIESDRLNVSLPVGTVQTNATPAKKPQHPTIAVGNDCTWRDIHIYMADGHTVVVRTPVLRHRYQYLELGFAKDNNRNPTLQWKLLLKICEGDHHHRHFVDYNGKTLSGQAVKKQVSELGKALQGIFGLRERPFQKFNKIDGWCPKFHAYDRAPGEIDSPDYLPTAP